MWRKCYKISQYADDTSLYLDGKESSLREVLSILDSFYFLSGLKMNAEKTKLIWIGALERSKSELCKEVNLEWGVTEFNSLGVNFSINVEDIWFLNTDKMMLEIQRLLTKWKKCDLTIIGRITVIKSLVLSKLVHLLIALPDPPPPPKAFIHNLKKMLYEYIYLERWPKRDILAKYDKGGLGMVDVERFNAALKLSWIKGFFTNMDAWSEPLKRLTLPNPLIWQVGSGLSLN